MTQTEHETWDLLGGAMRMGRFNIWHPPTAIFPTTHYWYPLVPTTHWNQLPTTTAFFPTVVTSNGAPFRPKTPMEPWKYVLLDKFQKEEKKPKSELSASNGALPSHSYTTGPPSHPENMYSFTRFKKRNKTAVAKSEGFVCRCIFKQTKCKAIYSNLQQFLEPKILAFQQQTN